MYLTAMDLIEIHKDLATEAVVSLSQRFPTIDTTKMTTTTYRKSLGYVKTLHDVFLTIVIHIYHGETPESVHICYEV